MLLVSYLTRYCLCGLLSMCVLLTVRSSLDAAAAADVSCVLVLESEAIVVQGLRTGGLRYSLVGLVAFWLLCSFVALSRPLFVCQQSCMNMLYWTSCANFTACAVDQPRRPVAARLCGPHPCSLRRCHMSHAAVRSDAPNPGSLLGCAAFLCLFPPYLHGPLYVATLCMRKLTCRRCLLLAERWTAPSPSPTSGRERALQFALTLTCLSLAISPALASVSSPIVLTPRPFFI
jgi:hypothetical protein